MRYSAIKICDYLPSSAMGGLTATLFAVPFWDYLSILFGNSGVTTLQTRVRRLTVGSFARWGLGVDSPITPV